MIKNLVLAGVSVAVMCAAVPAGAEEVGIGVGPGGVGVTVGTGHRDHYRDREVIRERRYRDRDETVVIKHHRDHHRDRDGKTVVIDRE